MECQRELLECLYKAGFKPDQPRIQQGQSGGGQWTNDYSFISQQHKWSKSETLKGHVDSHGKDFNTDSAREYAKKTKEFRERGIRNNYLMVEDKSGNIRIYDPKTNTFGA